MGVVWTEKGKCKRCYVCIRDCPVKAIRVKDGQAQVIGARCISCGVCVRLCKQGAKRVRDDVQRVLKLLTMEGKKVVILSPSFVVSFNNIGSLVTSLRLLGFTHVEEGGYGACLMIDEYKRQIGERGDGTIIASNCSAVVSLIERFYPELIKYLLKVVSHMIASILSIKERVGEEAHIVYVGPCIAKKEEIQRREGIKVYPDAVLTFQELKELFRRKGIDFDSQDEGLFDTPPFDPASSLISLPGGLSRLVLEGNKRIKEEEFGIINGREECIKVLRDLTEKKISPRFLEITLCKGCIDGPEVETDLSLFARRERVLNYVKRSYIKKEWKPVKIDLSRDFKDRSISLRMPTEEEIRRILKRTNKLRPEDELDCGACGYATCREKAIAVYQGIAEIEMCLPYLIEHITQEKNKVIDTIVRNMNDAVFTVDKDLRITLFNDAAEELTGFSRDEVLGKPHKEVFRSQGGSCPLETAMRTNKPISNYEMVLITKNGEEIPILISASILRDEEGKAFGGVSVFRDISRIKEIEQMKSDFVSNVSHELRTPLTSIKGSVDLLLSGIEGELTKSQKKFLEIVKSNTERLIRLINDLLDLSRIEAGRMIIRKRRLDLIPLIKETVTEIKRLAEEKGMEIHLFLPDKLPKVLVDADRIKQVVENLLSNAIKYTKEKGKIFIEAKVKEGNIKVSVKDTGIGISPRNFERIFEKFQPVNKELASIGKSIGLGLPISRSIVEAHNGRLWVEESQIGKGSKFSFILPIVPKEESEKKRITEIEPVETEERIVHKIRKVLVVDDDRDVVKVIEGYLKREGYEVLTAYSGKEVIENAIKFLPDIITLDLLMPEIDGFQLIETLKRYPELHDIPIIIVSIVEATDHEKILRLGIADYLVKPIDPSTLYSSIRNIERWLNQAKTKKKILVVDDEPSIVDVVKDALTKKGYMVISAYNGEEAIILAKRDKPHLIILDLIMPKMSGFRVIKELKKDNETNTIPIIALTARDLEEDKALALELGVSEYITKPFSQDILAEKIMEQISKEERKMEKKDIWKGQKS